MKLSEDAIQSSNKYINEMKLLFKFASKILQFLMRQERYSLPCVELWQHRSKLHLYRRSIYHLTLFTRVGLLVKADRFSCFMYLLHYYCGEILLLRMKNKAPQWNYDCSLFFLLLAAYGSVALIATVDYSFWIDSWSMSLRLFTRRLIKFSKDFLSSIPLDFLLKLQNVIDNTGL